MKGRVAIILNRSVGRAGWPPPFSREDDQSSRKDQSSRERDLYSLQKRNEGRAG